MTMPRRTIVLAATAALAGLAGCGGDDATDRLAAGDDFSVETALAELPVPETSADGTYSVAVADLDAATEINGAERPDSTDADAVSAWLSQAQGTVAPEGEAFPPVFVPPFETTGGARGGQASEVEDELGWSVVDVEAVAEVVAPPFRFGVVAGELDEATLEDADLEDVGDGVFSAGEGEDGETNPEDTTAARPIGAPLRLAAADGRIAVSSSTQAVQDWAGGEVRTLPEEAPLRAVAAALDEADVVSAHLSTSDPEATGYLAVGIGWTVEDGESRMVIVYSFGSEGPAERGAEDVEAAFAADSVVTGAPVADQLVLDDVEVDGTEVVAHVRPGPDGRPQSALDMLFEREVIFGLV